MKVRIGDAVYSTDDQPITLELSKEDRENISNMDPKATKFMEYEEGLMTEDEAKAKVMEEMPETLQIGRREVMEFVVDMEEQLAKNDHKGGWNDMKRLDLMHRLLEEANELMSAVIGIAPKEDIILFPLLRRTITSTTASLPPLIAFT